MKSSSRPPRTPANLSASLHHQLGLYSLAATAAGVGLLAVTSASEAKIVYTPAHRYVPLNSQLNIDFNHDGVTDLHIGRRSSSQTNTEGGTKGFVTWVRATGAIAGYRPVTQTTAMVASAFRAGQPIKSGLKFYRLGDMAWRWRSTRGSAACGGGQFNNVKDRYLGIKFLDAHSRVHYGWARVSESCNRYGKRGAGAKTLLTGYAYETIPGKSIITGKTKGPDVITLEPASLGHLAQGASAISAWRRAGGNK